MQSFDKDFFISYSKPDKNWAVWVAWILEENGYSVIIQAWDFRPGSNFVLDIQRSISESKRVIMVLSESYLESAYAQSEWTAAFTQDPDSRNRKLLPIKVKPCNLTGLLSSLQYVDLVYKSEIEARHILLSALSDRQKPTTRPHFPQPLPKDERTTSGSVPFPGVIKGLAALPFLSLPSLFGLGNSSYSDQNCNGRDDTPAVGDGHSQVASGHDSKPSLDMGNSLEDVFMKIVDKYDLDSLAIGHTIQISRYETITIEGEQYDENHENVPTEDEEHKTISIDSEHGDDSHDEHDDDSYDDDNVFV